MTKSKDFKVNSITKSDSKPKKHFIKSYVLKIRACVIFLDDEKS